MSPLEEVNLQFPTGFTFLITPSYFG